MNRTVTRPPTLAVFLVALCCRAIDRDVVLGDLEEEFHDYHLDEGFRTARRWYWRQAIHSMSSLLRMKFASLLSARPVEAAFAGTVTAIFAATLFGLLLQRLLPVPNPADATFAQIVLVVTLCALVSSTCGGWAATRRGQGTDLRALLWVALVALAPDFLHAARSDDWSPLLGVLPLISVAVGLPLGVRLSRVKLEKSAA